ncbi:transposase [Streptomyces griseorubiginosus]|uniref:transposase n=1 Tax=Streptomyces griseorubiginosus TaxID=67304 RepID=UPI003AF3A9D7
MTLSDARRTGVPEDVGHLEKWRLALDALDELAGWHLVPPVVVADAGYGQNTGFRAGPAERGHTYVVGIRGDLTVQPHDAVLPRPPCPRPCRLPCPPHRDRPCRLPGGSGSRCRHQPPQYPLHRRPPGLTSPASPAPWHHQ